MLLSPNRTGAAPSSAITSKRQVRPSNRSTAHVSGGTTASTKRWRRENSEQAEMVTHLILSVRRAIEVGKSTQTGAFEGRVQLFALGLKLTVRVICGNLGPLRPTDRNPREGLGHQKVVPGTHGPGVLGLQVEGADRRAGHLRQFDGTHLGAIDRSQRP